MQFLVHNKIPEHLGPSISDMFNLAGPGSYAYWPNIHSNSIRNQLVSLSGEKSGNNSDIIIEYQGRFVIFLRFVFLKWDSEHFGYSCYKIQIQLINMEFDFQFYTQKLIPFIKKKFDEFNLINKIRFVFADTDARSKIQNAIMHGLGFSFIVSWIDGFKIPNIEPNRLIDRGLSFGLIEEGEVSYLSEIAKNDYFEGGRFFFDHHFDDNKVREMYSSLVINSAKNDLALVLKMKNRPVGLFIVKKIQEYSAFDFMKVAHLRYLIIDPEFRQQGLGKIIFINTINYLCGICDLVTTGLEVSNIESLNLHIKLGFKFNYSHNAYHYWNHSV
jgi:hypothetical protein